MVDLRFCLRFREEIRRCIKCDVIEKKIRQGNAAEYNVTEKKQDSHHRLCEATAQLVECLTYSLNRNAICKKVSKQRQERHIAQYSRNFRFSIVINT